MRINVLYQFNETYAPYAGVSIFSLLENNSEAEEIVIYILGEELKEDSIEKITKMIHEYKRKVIFFDGKEIINLIKTLDIPTYRGAYATNLKMFFPLSVDEDIRKILYIDSDTLVLGDISPLFGESVLSKPVSMVLDSLAVKHKRYIGHKKNEAYYNGGVMLIDLLRWKEEKCTEKIIEHVKNTRAHYMAPDQDIINVALKYEIGRLSPRYNLQPLHYKYKYNIYKRFWKQENYYDQEELDRAVKDPVIIHFFRFLGEFPWNKDSNHPCTKLFNDYLKKSPWNRLKTETSIQEGIIFTIERYLYRMLPDSMFMLVFKIGYDFFIKKAERESQKGKNYKRM